MRNIFKYMLLFIPLFFFGLVWLGRVFGIDPIPDGFLRDDTFEYSGDGKKPTGLVSLTFFNTIGFIAMIPGFFIGSIYALINKLWWWFTAYIILGFGLWLYLTF